MTKKVTDCLSLDEIFENCFPAFGGAYLRRVYLILDRAISEGYPLTLSIAGPVTVSEQHFAWIIPLLEMGWIAYISTTDAVCYHDGHRGLSGESPFHSVPLFCDDGALRDDGIIRVADVGFDESVLGKQDKFLVDVLRQPEFQRKMTGTEMRYLLGKHYGEQEEKVGAPAGLLSTCHRLAIPVLVGAPADGSVFLNSMKLWAEKQLGHIKYDFELDLHAEVFESCAYHLWGLREKKGLATLVLGGGVPKNFNLQPEPALSQILGLPNIRGYTFDVQITTAPVTDGSLSSCWPAEAVTWGKVDRKTYEQTTESLQADYSMLMPFVVRSLIEKHSFPRKQFRLFDRRTELVERLKTEIQDRCRSQDARKLEIDS